MESTIDHIAGVLALFADPAKTKHRLDELLTAMKKFEHAKAENEASLKALHTAQQKLTVTRDAVEKHSREVEELKQKLTAREIALAAEEKEFRERALRVQREFTERERDLAKRESLIPSVESLIAAQAGAAKRGARN
jgi:predicted  nucleic acid-binding Zn-ribbon protein